MEPGGSGDGVSDRFPSLRFCVALGGVDKDSRGALYDAFGIERCR